MDKLPEEILRMIFYEYLHLKDIVTCRLLSKKMKFIVDGLNFKKLTVFGYDLLLYVHEWNLTKSAIYFEDIPGYHKRILLFWKPLFFNSTSFQILFKNLKYLNIVDNWEPEVDHFSFKEFNELEKLHVAQIGLSDDKELDFPKLKLFSSECVYRKTRPLRKKVAPKLILKSKINQLYCKEGLENVKFIHPREVLCLQAEEILYEDLHLLRNLEIVHFQFIYALSPKRRIHLNFLLGLKCLKEIHWSPYDLYDETSKTLDALTYLKNQTLDRKNLKIFFLDVLIIKPIEDYQFTFDYDRFINKKGQYLNLNYKDRLKIQFENYSQLSDASLYHEDVVYHILIDFLHDYQSTQSKNQLFDLFFKKFNNIKQVFVSRIDNENDFLSFLKRCKIIRYLIFDSSCLTQSILNRLPDVCESLEILFIDSLSNQKNDKLKCNEILKLKELRKFFTFDFVYDPEFYSNIFIECRNFFFLEVRLEDESFKKRKLSLKRKKDGYETSFDDKHNYNKNHLSFQDLKKYVAKIFYDIEINK